MNTKMTILALLAVGAASAAQASKDDCFVPMADWQPREAVMQLAEQNGWAVRRLKIDDGCYEVDGRDSAGREIEVTVHPGTLQVIEIEFEDADDAYEQRDHDKRRDAKGGQND